MNGSEIQTADFLSRRETFANSKEGESTTDFSEDTDVRNALVEVDPRDPCAPGNRWYLSCSSVPC